MSRSTANTKIQKREVIKNQNLQSPYLSQWNCIGHILQIFMKNKQKNNEKQFIQRMKKIRKMKSKVEKIMIQTLKTLMNNKITQNLGTGVQKMKKNMFSSRKLQKQKQQAKKQKIKNMSCNLLSSISKRIHENNLRTVLQSIKNKGKNKQNYHAYRAKLFARTINQITNKKLQVLFNRTKTHKITTQAKKNKIKCVRNLFEEKVKANKIWAFLKMLNYENNIYFVVDNDEVIFSSSKKQNNFENSKQDSSTRKQLEEKNKNIQHQIQFLKNENGNILENFREEIKVLEQQHQELKFNNQILDESNRELENELIQRQKKCRKKMSSMQLWDHIYSNFLLFVKRNCDSTIEKETLLKCLQTPLTNINFDIDAIKMENSILSDLLEEYKKFYQETEFAQKSADDELLPFDVLSAKSRFLYAAAENLISQGIGTEGQVKQLQSDLQNICKHG